MYTLKLLKESNFGAATKKEK